MIAGQSPADCETFISLTRDRIFPILQSITSWRPHNYLHYLYNRHYLHSKHYLHTIYAISTHHLHSVYTIHYLHTIYPLSTHAGRARGLVSAPPLHGVLPRAAAPRGHRHQLLQLLPAPPPGLCLHTQERFAATCYMFVSGQWMFCKKHKVFLVRINILISLCNFSRKSPFEHEY